MKTNSSLLFILVAVFFLTSCGAKKTSATFEVSTSALSVNNSSYTGGLVIMGKSKSGSFTIPIPTGGSGNKITLDLPRDSWTFSAIGWEGAGHFQGNSKCGSLADVDLNQDEQTVNLAIDYPKCGADTATFGTASYRIVTSYANLAIVTCGWLYESDGSTPVSNLTALNYCDSVSGIDAKYKNWAKSIKIEIPKIINGVRTTGLSRCYAAGTDGQFSSPTINPPEKGVPFVITLYNQPSCPNDDTIISKFEFNDGLGVTLADFDSALNPGGGGVRLFLPSFDTKRGYSSLLSNKPAILCGGNPCTNVPTDITPGQSRMIASGNEFVLIENPSATQTCDNISGISASGISATPSISTAIVKAGCESRDGKLTLRLNFTSLTTASLTVNFSDATVVTLSLEENVYRNAHNFAWETLGFPIADAMASTSALKSSFKAFFDRVPNEGGLLTEVREMMGPEGAGGILGDGLNCVTDTKSNLVTFKDEGVDKTYKVELLNGTTLPYVGTYLADGTRLASNSFQKKITISERKSDGTFKSPQMTMHFDCGYSIGRMYSEHIKSGKVEKRLIEWNTQDNTITRVKEMKYEEESDAIRPIRVHTSLRYVESPGDMTKQYVRSYEMNINWDSTLLAYKFYPKSSQIVITSANSGFTFVQASPTFNQNTSLSDTTGVSNLVTSFAGAPSLCVDKVSFSPGNCSVLPLTFNAQPEYENFVQANLIPGNMILLFP